MTSEWTVATLKEYVDKVTDNRFAAQEQAILKQATETRENRVKDNEFRNQLRDQTATFPTRAEVDARFTSLEEKIASKNVQLVVSFVLASVSALVAVASFASRLGG